MNKDFIKNNTVPEKLAHQTRKMVSDARVLTTFLFIFSSLFFLLPLTASADINTGLVGYWTMDGRDTNWATNKINDRSGNGNTGNITSMSTTTSPTLGKVGQALYFDGVDDYVNVTETSGLPIHNYTANSVSLWVKGPANQDDKRVFTEGSSSNGTPVFDIGTNLASGKVDMFIRNDVGDARLNHVLSTGVAFDGTWHHIVWVDNNGTAALYIDGALDSQNFNYTKEILTLNRTSIGNVLRAAPAFYFNGSIDEVRTYTRALSAQDVKQLYNQGKVKISSNSAARPTSDKLMQGLTAYWTMDGKDINWNTNTIIDKSGNGNTGTLTSMSTTTSPALGALGQSLNFGRISSDYMYTAGDLLGPGDKTFCVWVNPERLSSGSGYIVYTPSSSFMARLNSSNVIIVSSNSITTTLSGSTIASNVWSHVCVVRQSSGNATIYVNNTSVASGSTGTPDPEVAGLYVGNLSAANRVFPGKMDELRIYNRLLGAQEITQLYKQGLAKISSTPTVKPATAPLSQGLTAYWTMDGKDINWNTNTIIDKSGNGNTGTLTSMSTTTSPALGALGQSLNFGRISSDYMYTAGDLLGPGDKTFCVWVNPERLSSGSGYIVYTPSSSFMARLNSSNVIIVSSNSITTTLSGSTIASNVWSHVCVVRQSSGNATIYVNNTSVASGSTGTPDPEVAGLYVGNLSAANRVFPGKMDELRIYNRLLGAQEITQLYKLGLARHR